ncbi:MAG: Flp pilus assembly complex ATPase component TadA [Candidatus Diapherotrites archaeon]|nr:Flp pilus assembly complex ATPase component TadA [Candidatus Diapherotrites archaeon]
MQLSRNKELCKDCSQECIADCPLSLSINSLDCIHCNPEEAPCRIACPRNAIYEVAAGILKIDPKLCNGCLECVAACPLNAISIVNGKAAKCDLCVEIGRPLCISACPKGNLKLVQSEKELKRIEELLGWQKIFPSIKAEIAKSSENKIVKETNGRLRYIVDIPNLTLQEAKLIREAITSFREFKNKDIEKFMKEYCLKHMIKLQREQKEYLLKIIEAECFGNSVLETILNDENIEEISVIGIGKRNPVLVYHRNFGWIETNIYIASEKGIVNLANRFARTVGRRLTMQHPKLNATLKDGSRLSAAAKQISFFGPTFTIRLFKQRITKPKQLIENGTISKEAMAFLWLAMETDASILIAGNTGSGKTTMLNCLFRFVPKDERIIVVEETPELNIPHKHQIKLVTAENLKIGMQELITETLRMRPDRIIVGEIRSREEISAFIDTMLAGQGKGSYATFHALTAEEAVKRFRRHGILEIDVASIDLIIVMKRWTKIDRETNARKELRRVMEICELNKNAEVRKIFEYNFAKDKLEKVGKSRRILKKVKATFGFKEKEFWNEIKKRAERIDECN